jgi:intracellular sulfur oxidation DsrE/DsrF family protein
MPLLPLLVGTLLLVVPVDAQAQNAATPPSGPDRASVSDAAPPADRDAAAETAYLVRSPGMLPVVLMSARQSLNGEAEFSAAAADVIAVGPAVKGLTADGQHADAVARSLDAGVRVVACGLAMEKVRIAETELVDGVAVVPNGFHELLRLQNEGYVSLQL